MGEADPEFAITSDWSPFAGCLEGHLNKVLSIMAVHSQPGSSPNMDETIPRLAAVAVRQAYERAMLIQGRVVVAEGGRLVEVRADGSKEVRHALPAGRPVRAGETLLRKRAR